MNSEDPLFPVSTKILIVGCGGVGLELAKFFYPSQMTLVDFDKIEISNLHRQFLYSQSDCGKYKADVASRKFGSKGYVSRLEDLPIDVYNQHTIIFSCLDSVSSRMNLNQIFFKSSSKILIDCGVTGFQFHIKKVTKESSCLYCIKNLYPTTSYTSLCTLSNTAQRVTELNREKILRSLIDLNTQKAKEDAIITGKTHILSDEETKKLIENILYKFNSISPKNLKTTSFEVKGLLFNIIPNICTTNSICASFAINCVLFEKCPFDFIYYNGDISKGLKRLTIQKDPSCIICSKSNIQKIV